MTDKTIRADDYVVLVVPPLAGRLYVTDLPGVYSPRLEDARRWRGVGDERAAHKAAHDAAGRLDQSWRVFVVYDLGSDCEAARQVHANGAETFVEGVPA